MHHVFPFTSALFNERAPPVIQSERSLNSYIFTRFLLQFQVKLRFCGLFGHRHNRVLLSSKEVDISNWVPGNSWRRHHTIRSISAFGGIKMKWRHWTIIRLSYWQILLSLSLSGWYWSEAYMWSAYMTSCQRQTWWWDKAGSPHQWTPCSQGRCLYPAPALPVGGIVPHCS